MYSGGTSIGVRSFIPESVCRMIGGSDNTAEVPEGSSSCGTELVRFVLGSPGGEKSGVALKEAIRLIGRTLAR